MTPIRKLMLGGGLAATAMFGGALGATMIGTSGAATTATTATPATAPATSAAPSGAGYGHGGGGPHTANGITETLLTGDTKTKAVAAAEAAVPGGTVERAETDAEGAAYEVHMTKTDGSTVTVKLDSNFNVTETIDGRG